jgi:hypothetical protein
LATPAAVSQTLVFSLSVPPSLAGSLCASVLCGRQRRRRRCEKADHRKEKEDRGRGRRIEGGERGGEVSRNFFGFFVMR